MKPKEILEFWFEEVTPKQKFTKDPEFDALITKRFESAYWDVLEGKTKDWL